MNCTAASGSDATSRHRLLIVVNLVAALFTLMPLPSTAIEAPAAPAINGLTVAQRRGNIVEIFYTLSADDPCQVTVDYSLDSGSSWTPVSSAETIVNSAIGTGITPGRNKRIGWDITGLFTGDLTAADSATIDVRVRADDGNVVVVLPGNLPLVLRKIPAGTFSMGSPDNEPGHENHEGPRHEVSISEFYLGEYEVTQEQWMSLLDPNFATFNCDEWVDVNFANPAFFWGECDRPVEGGLLGQTAPPGLPTMSWDSITSLYLPALNSVAGDQGQGPFTLPTEAQWEYACRGGTDAAYNNGTGAAENERHTNLDPVAWYEHNTSVSRIVGQKQPNSLGLYDMHGNVREWCLDGARNYTIDAVTDPVGPVSGVDRVVRGGAWNKDALSARSAARRVLPKNTSRGNIGFRIAGTGTPRVAEQVKTMTLLVNEGTDSDDDDLPDAWETQIIDADLTDGIVTIADVLASDDFDNDGIDHSQEFEIGASPVNWDSDGDGMDDGFEASHGPDLSPIIADQDDDADADGLTNFVEYTGADQVGSKKDDSPADGIAEVGSPADTLDPTTVDSDSDGLGDKFEYDYFVAGILEPSNPNSDNAGDIDADEDPDNDGLINSGEEAAGTNPFLWDTDGDGLDDAFEALYNPDLDPLIDDADADPDADGLSNLTEYVGKDGVAPKKDDDPADGTAEDVATGDTLNPAQPDSDGDGLGDKFEFDNFRAGVLDPAMANSDNAGANDGAEDPDNDGLINSGEEAVGTVPLLWDTDGDGMDDGFETLHSPSLDPGNDDSAADPDADGLSNMAEYLGKDEIAAKKDDNPADGIAEDVATSDSLDPKKPDTDGDGLLDHFEFVYFRSGVLDPASANSDGVGPADGDDDPDNDGLITSDEAASGTDPHHWDSDGDGMDDLYEVTYGPELSPLANDADQDPDGDGLANSTEYFGKDGIGRKKDDAPADGTAESTGSTDTLHPLSSDSDGDGLGDKLEFDNFVAGLLDPAVADSDHDTIIDAAEDLDGDGLANLAEVAIGTSIKNWDSDHDGMDDGYEVRNGLDPLNSIQDDALLDPDGDTVSNLDEYKGDDGVAPLVDPDGDGIAAIDSADSADALNPNSDDTDNDKMKDAFELSTTGLKASDPTDAKKDFDNDGLKNVTEFLLGLLVNDWDTDNDGMDDGFESRRSLKPLVDNGALDRDGDGLSNMDEYIGKDQRARLMDSDSDGIAEVNPEDSGDTLNPNSNDSDADDIPDGIEWTTAGLSASDDTDADGDLDGDGATNVDEYLNGAVLMTNWDSDGDGMDDGFELRYGLNVSVDDGGQDPDNDMVTNLDEYRGLDQQSPLVDDGTGTTTARANQTDIGDGTNPMRPTTRFQNGWNLIATPWNLNDTVDNQINQNIMPTIWTWTGDRFAAVTVDSEENDKLIPGFGYWIYSTADCHLDIPGKAVTGSTIDLSPGWNLIGTVVPGVVLDLGDAIGPFWGWDGARLGRAGETMERFKGYWIYSPNKTVITLP